uniref:CsbD family protein n=1 Tax=Delftia sp. ASV31 TaxID=2795113 RepID=UPI0018EC8F70
NWKQFTGKIREQWGKLTDDDLDVIAGKREQFLGKLQERQGLALSLIHISEPTRR